jgi:hypothetical protein
MLFNQARKRLAFGGCMYVLFSTDSDLDLLGNLISPRRLCGAAGCRAVHL